jgi:ribosome-binding protein aMBF1 (putative translation factor)
MRSRNETALRRKLSALRDRVAAEPDDAAFYSQIAEQVVEQRRLRRLSQQELAELCGTTQPGIARFERGESAPRVDTLLRMAAALDCELVVKFRPRTKPKGGRR